MLLKQHKTEKDFDKIINENKRSNAKGGQIYE